MFVKKAESIVNLIEKKTLLPIQNRKLFTQYVIEALTLNKPITFYNWECPPRKINKTKNGKFFIDYDLDLKKIFRGEKIDSFTELPRAVEFFENETSMLNFFLKLGLPFRFVKLIADTNAYYITPESFRIKGKNNIVKKFEEFRDLIRRRTLNYPVKTKVLLFKQLVEPFLSEYKRVYKDAFSLMERKGENLISASFFKEQVSRTQTHIGVTDKNWAKNFSIRTIATYAAEGVVFDLLSKKTNFSNWVWLNNHEIDERTIEITNCFRRKVGLGDLPMIFWNK